MSDEKANKLKADDAASEAVPETGPEFSPEFPPESLDVDDLIPGLAEAVGAEAVASGVIAQLEADCFEMKDKLLRALAESENIRPAAGPSATARTPRPMAAPSWRATCWRCMTTWTARCRMWTTRCAIRPKASSRGLN
jgi:hypothetical protein